MKLPFRKENGEVYKRGHGFTGARALEKISGREECFSRSLMHWGGKEVGRKRHPAGTSGEQTERETTKILCGRP